MITLPARAPGEVLDYSIDWSDALADGDSVQTVTVTVTGATKDESSLLANVSTIRISGGTAGTIVRIAASAVTAGEQTIIRTIVVPFGEPLTLEQAKAQCKLEADDSDEDELLAGYIAAARKYVEEATGLILVRRQLTEEYEDWGACDRRRGRHLTLTLQPIVSVDSITYVDPYEAEQTYADPIIRIGKVFTRIYPALGGCWPALSCRGGVTVAYTAGYADGEVPETAVQAMRLMIAHWYANREAVVAGGRAVAVTVPLSAEALCDQLRLARV